MKLIKGSVTAPKGFLASGIYCGIRKNAVKKDLALIYSETLCNAASVYTLNKVKGAPLIVTKKNLSNGKAQAIICNSGNANTCNADGIEIAEKTCKALSESLKINAEDVIVSSTGVIGVPLDVNKIVSSIPKLIESLSKDGSADAASAILTTDLVPKEIAVSFNIGGRECKIGGIAKGSGMINPNMATMLVFITTDVCISSEMLAKALKDSADDTFNMISIDGDTSTNDMVSILANGRAGNKEITDFGEDYATFLEALNFVNASLCKMIAKDGEGATKLLICHVFNAKDKQTARIAAKSVISSNLTKAAMFGADANWGRVLCALGYAKCELDVNKIDMRYISKTGEILVCKDGMGVNFDEDKAKKILLDDEITIDVNLNDGECEANAYGCDLTYDYVKINGSYRT